MILGGGLLIYLFYRFSDQIFGLFSKENTRFSWEKELTAVGGIETEEGRKSAGEGDKGRDRDVSNSSANSKGFQFGDVYNPGAKQSQFTEVNMQNKQNADGVRSKNEKSTTDTMTKKSDTPRKQQQQEPDAIPIWRWYKLHGLHK